MSFNTKYEPPERLTALMETLIHSLAKNMWNTYKVAGNYVKRLRQDLVITLTFPFSLDDTMMYIGYLLSFRKVQGGIWDNNLRGLWMAPMLQGPFSILGEARNSQTCNKRSNKQGSCSKENGQQKRKVAK